MGNPYSNLWMENVTIGGWIIHNVKKINKTEIKIITYINKIKFFVKLINAKKYKNHQKQISQESPFCHPIINIASRYSFSFPQPKFPVS